MSDTSKMLNVTLNGFNVKSLKPIKIRISMEKEATLSDMMKYIETNYEEEALWITKEYGYIFHALNAIIFLDNAYIDHEKWKECIPSENSKILIIPPISDG